MLLVTFNWEVNWTEMVVALYHYLWFASIPLIQHGCQKNGWGTAHSNSWATPSAYEKQNNGEPGQTVPIIIIIIKCTD